MSLPEVMKTLQTLVIIAVAGLGYHVWQRRHAAQLLATQFDPSLGDFMATAMPTGAEKDKVLILAPQNCPKAGAQRARALEARLDQAGIPWVTGDRASLRPPMNPTAEERDSIQHAADVLNGPVPPVFVNGMGKANPSAEEVIRAYNRTKG